MNEYNQSKQNAMAFVSKIPDFQKNLGLLDNFLETIEINQLSRLKYFLGMTQLLFMEQNLSGGYSCKTGIMFNKLTVSEIHIFIEDIQNGKYDTFL